MQKIGCLDRFTVSRSALHNHPKRHELLVGRLLLLQQKGGVQSLLPSAAREWAPQLSESLAEAWRLLGRDAGCPDALVQSVRMSSAMNQSGEET